MRSFLTDGSEENYGWPLLITTCNGNVFCNAVGVAIDPQPRGRGALVMVNDWLHGARTLTKTSTTVTQTLMSHLRGLVGISIYAKNDF